MMQFLERTENSPNPSNALNWYFTSQAIMYTQRT